MNDDIKPTLDPERVTETQVDIGGAHFTAKQWEIEPEPPDAPAPLGQWTMDTSSTTARLGAFDVAGHLYELRVWTPEDWARERPDRRPDPACTIALVGGRGFAEIVMIEKVLVAGERRG
jgi:hypothetical protein